MKPSRIYIGAMCPFGANAWRIFPVNNCSVVEVNDFEPPDRLALLLLLLLGCCQLILLRKLLHP
jgi:hypothetical protein